MCVAACLEVVRTSADNGPGFDDLSVRFLLNLPKSELESIPRLCFQLEEAQWYYEDFVRPLAAAIGRPLPGMHLRQFCLQLFQHCPLLSGFTSEQHLAAYEEFLAYKVRVPVRGAILLDETMERVVLVKGWKKGASWSFPRGKINKDEKDLDCTIREVWEETGFDIRAAGLVPENEQDAKYIDITMREQHMRMFVFRDVPLETVFEPKTRKEISKIQWYNLRDLPGFAKRSRNDGEGGNTNKFYMVAPFMNHIKKWIGQQKRKDEAILHTEEQLIAHGLDAPQAVGEHPSFYAQQANVPAPAADHSEELKRLLYIGGPSPATVHQTPSLPQTSQANNLLAMLQGSAPGQQTGPPPQTPLDQLNAFMPSQPESPHPRHPRQPPGGHQPPPPQFPITQPGMPQQNQYPTMSAPPPSFGQPANSNRMPGLNGLAAQIQHSGPQHLQSRIPPVPSAQPYPHAAGGLSQPNMQPQHVYPSQPAQTIFQPRQASSSGEFQVQGQHGAIASGPSAPNASQLPPPKLTAQSIRLLDAFKTGQKSEPQPVSSNAAPRSGSAHQSALLGLFKPGLASEPVQTSQDPRAEQAIVSPAPDELTAAPAPLQERRPTLNEITRSLPLNFKAKRPSQHSPTVPLQMTPAAPNTMQAPPIAPKDATSSAQLEALAPPQPPALSSPQPTANVLETRPPNGSSESKRKDVPVAPAKQIMQRSGARQGSGRGPRDKKGASPSPARQARTKANEPPVHMTILARPGSAKERSGSAASGSPRQPFQPQLLKRQDGGELPVASPTVDIDATGGESSGDGTGKRDQLLALFSKSPSVPQAPREELPSAGLNSPPAPCSPQAPATTNNNTLLNLMNSSAPAQQASQKPSPEPPAAPALQPAQRPSKPRTPAPPPIISHPPQNALLDLFKKPNHAPSPSIESPISPFNLGSPHAMRHGKSGPQEQPRSRLGSMASGSGSGHATPTEQKDFLLGFLNGVVQKEGQRK